MKQTVFEVTRTALAMVSGSCLISLMALFMGGGQGGTDLSALMYLQAALTPVAIVIVAIIISLQTSAFSFQDFDKLDRIEAIKANPNNVISHVHKQIIRTLNSTIKSN